MQWRRFVLTIKQLQLSPPLETSLDFSQNYLFSIKLWRFAKMAPQNNCNILKISGVFDS